MLLEVRGRPRAVAAGSTCDVPVTSTDFYPTWLEAAGLPPMPAQHCDGESLVPLLTRRAPLARDALFWHYPHYGNQGGTPGSSVRQGNYKLIEFFEDGRLELYNLSDDPGEKRNLALADATRARAMHAILLDWQKKVAAKIPQTNLNWTPQP